MNEREKLAAYAYMFDGDWARIADAEKNHLTPDPITIKENYITCLDEDYPGQLRGLRYPPWVVFYRGDISLLKRRMISIIGSRDLQPYGAACTRWCADLLKKDFVLVSGLARGADGLVHRCALDGGATIGIIGSGFSRIYPSCNMDLYYRMERDHLILSEYPYHTGIRKHHFPWRNRLIAALGEALIVTQAEIRSGTMLTVNEAAALSRDIYAVPWPLFDSYGAGCNRLIAEGAMILHEEGQLKDLVRKY